MTNRGVGLVMNVSRSRVDQIEKRTLRRRDVRYMLQAWADHVPIRRGSALSDAIDWEARTSESQAGR